jgi:hypothetical protein
MSVVAPDKKRNLLVFPVMLLLLSLVILVVPVRAPAAGLVKPIKGQNNVQSSFNDSKMTVCDVDNDGVQEILAGNLNGNMYCFTPSGKVKWAKYCGASIRGAAACYDVDGNKTKEIFWGDMNGVVWGVACNGADLTQWGWPKPTANTGGFVGVYSTPAIGDINNDGAPDIVVTTYGHYIYAWSYSGGQLPGWPFDQKDTLWSSPSLADINRDGLKEVVVGGDCTGGNGWPYPAGGLLWVFRGDGTVQPGFPAWTPEVLWSAPACADIDNDGWHEIVIGTGHYYTAINRLSSEGFVVYAFRHDGSLYRSWPAAGCTMSSPAVGDIDRDGVKEIAIACYPVNGRGADHLMLIKGNGGVMWDQTAFGGPNRASPVMGDVTGDGQPEIILGSGQAIGAWDVSGRCVWNQVLDNFVITSAAVGDFDSDGRVECAVGTGGEQGGGCFYVFDCCKKKAGVSDKKLFPWPMFRRTPDHAGNIPTGFEPPPPPPPPPPANFHEYILLMNPGAKAAKVKIEFMNEKAEKKVAELTVDPGSRSTVFVNRFMPGCGVSAKVTSDEPIISERAMYFNYQGLWKGGTDSAGTPEPARNWYLAEGYTADNFDTFVLVQNPNSAPARVDMTFMREGASPVNASYDVPGGSRFTLNLKSVPGLESTSVSTKISATGEVICERSMYFNYKGFIGGHNSMGVPEPKPRWYLAEGYTAQSYDTYVLVQNPGSATASVNMSFLRKDGYQKEMKLKLPPRSRKTVKVDEVPGFEAAEVSTEVTSNVDVVSERAMYFNADGRDGGHESVGVSEPARRWYLAEGYTGGTFDSWALIMNPDDKAAMVTTTFMRSDGYKFSRNDVVGPRSRFTIHIDEQPGFENAEVSTLIETQAGPGVIAERAMYFVYNDLWCDGHDAAGVSGASKTWYFAEGYTGM